MYAGQRLYCTQLYSNRFRFVVRVSLMLTVMIMGTIMGITSAAAASFKQTETDPDEHASEGGRFGSLHDDALRSHPRVTQHQDGQSGRHGQERRRATGDRQQTVGHSRQEAAASTRAAQRRYVVIVVVVAVVGRRVISQPLSNRITHTENIDFLAKIS